MSPREPAENEVPGDSERRESGVSSLLMGLGFSVVLTLASFWAASTGLIYGPGVPLLLGVLAIAQMGVHLVFFFHLSSAPDQTNNFLALAFGIMVVGLVVFGSMVIISDLNDNMMASPPPMNMQP
jgi:cytochrome o ubiquinol oxidase operon protein cyoD